MLQQPISAQDIFRKVTPEPVVGLAFELGKSIKLEVGYGGAASLASGCTSECSGCGDGSSESNWCCC